MVILSPMFALMVGMGHSLFMAMTRRQWPSGFAERHPTVKLRTRGLASVGRINNDKGFRTLDRENAILREQQGNGERQWCGKDAQEPDKNRT